MLDEPFPIYEEMIEFNLPQLLSIIPHKWMTVDELHTVGANWNLKNPYVIEYKNNAADLGRLIEREGTFWPLTADVESLGVREGCHRVIGLQEIDSKKPFLVLLPELKYYEQSAEGVANIYLKVSQEQLDIWGHFNLVEDNIAFVESLSQAMHIFNWHAGQLSKYFYTNPPKPHPAMNDQKYFEEWYAKKKNELYRV